MNQFLQPNNGIPRATKSGIIVLIVLITIVLVFRYTYQPSKANPSDFTVFEQQIEQYKKELYAQLNKHSIIKEFNPNTDSIGALINAGLPKKVAYNLVKYRRAGAYFKRKEDLKKVYGLSDSLYIAISDYVVITPSLNNHSKSYRQVNIAATQKRTGKKNLGGFEEGESIRKNRPKIDCNTADSAGLTRIKGIGPILAARVIKYRELLGGYAHKSQLLEVYGIKEENYKTIESQIFLSDGNLQIININVASFKRLNKHPYLTYNQTKSLLRYRDIMLRFDSVALILQHHLVDSQTYENLKPYLCVN